MDMETKKVVLVGDARVGKTSLVRFALTGAVENRYIHTLGVEVHPIVWNSPQWGLRRFNVWDCAGNPHFGGLREGYYVQAQIAIVMYDNVGLNSHEDWVTAVRNVCPTVPIVKCVNHFQGALPNDPMENGCFHVKLSNGDGVDRLFEHLMTV
jgi:GTP-binding nuclear protein Ran